MSKYIVLAALFVGLVIFKIGAMQGAVEHYTYDASYPYAYESALVNQSPVASESWSVRVRVTGYSSRVEETDDSPFVTASGTSVRDGVVAANWLPFGTKVRVPELFGEQVFVVEDRMHKRNRDKLDIWFQSTEEALRFGTQVARVEIL
jgi:3D (Asp-Asp-Asp) domain-containing protein